MLIKIKLNLLDIEILCFFLPSCFLSILLEKFRKIIDKQMELVMQKINFIILSYN